MPQKIASALSDRRNVVRPWGDRLKHRKGSLMAAKTKSNQSQEPVFTISRTFDAPRELVWKAFTEAERLKQWWGPKGFKVTAAKLDLRPGGVFHYGMRSPEGHVMWGKFTYREIAAPERLVFVVSFSDEKGGVTRHPMSENWPLETLSTITFAEHGGKTTINLQWVPVNATKAERKTFADSHQSMQTGWTGTMDQFADYLANASEATGP
jgi:uncharacterized protein YndB with AHSA1/START domain